MASIIGLTGSIGSGKSTVTTLFLEAGIPVIDADRLSRELTGPHEVGSLAVAKTFGTDFLTPTGAMDRFRMRNLVFQDPAALYTLENILHPLIALRVEEAFQRHRHAPLVVYDCPLLYKKALRPLSLTRILVVDAPNNIRLKRILTRPGLDRETALHMMNAQPPRKTFLNLADDILSNASTFEDLRKAFSRYLCRFPIEPVLRSLE